MKLVRMVLCTIGAVVIATSGLAQQQPPPAGDPPRTPPSNPAPAPQPPSPPTQPSQPKAKEPVVKLLNPGAEPRSELRLRINQGDVSKVELITRLSLTHKVGEISPPTQTMPPVRIVFETKVTNVNAAGDAAYDIKFTDVSIGKDTPMNPQTVEQMESRLRALIGLKGSGVASSRGFTRSVEIEVPDGASPGVRQQIQAMKQSLNQMTMPLPEEPIGVGGKWQVESEVIQNGITVRQVRSLTLTAIDGDEVSLESVVAQIAEPQTAPQPGVPNATREIESMTGTGEGKVQLRLTRLLPVQAETFLSSDTQMMIKMGEKLQPMKEHMEIRLTLKTVTNDEAAKE